MIGLSLNQLDKLMWIFTGINFMWDTVGINNRNNLQKSDLANNKNYLGDNKSYSNGYKISSPPQEATSELTSLSF
jgi:hypothetical protein